MGIDIVLTVCQLLDRRYPQAQWQRIYMSTELYRILGTDEDDEELKKEATMRGFVCCNWQHSTTYTPKVTNVKRRS